MTGLCRALLVALLLSLVAAAGVGFVVWRTYNASFTSTENADFIRIRGDRGFVLLGPEFMRNLMGDAWASSRLYSTCAGWRTSKETLLQEMPLQPLPAASNGVVLKVPRADAEWASMIVYSSGLKKLCGLEVDLVHSSVMSQGCNLVESLDRKLIADEMKPATK